MASVQDVQAALTTLGADVEALVSRVQPAQDLQPVVDQVNAIAQRVQQIAPPAA